MAKSTTTLAKELLDDGAGRLEELRIHMFPDLEDDEEALDDEAMQRLYAEFSAEFDRAEAALTKQYGKPSRTGTEEVV